MKVLIVYNGIIPTPLYGGTSRVIWYLGNELVKMGHKVSYLVNKGSSCPFAEVNTINPAKAIVEQIGDDVDLVHFNMIVPGIEQLKKPYVVTMHGNGNKDVELPLNTIFVSRNHAERYASSSFVNNGLDWDDYMTPNLNEKRNYFHFLGKAAWKIKNVKGAIDIVKNTPNERLKVLGGNRLNFKMGFRFTTSMRVSFHGMVGGEKKYQLLNGSKGLIFPVRWHEPFGLAITESLYYGCPVFGTPYGALPDLVSNEVGFLSNKQSDLVNAVKNSEQYSKTVCHQYAVDEFNSLVMAKSYVEKYEQVLNGDSLNATAPFQASPEKKKMLDWSV
ncbi:glycosyltransferase [Carboxylicivirga sp. A043]|uniref:glycosyltransferase n=1 Tax=Carboxylicivirga litoralis TaxID=2816963 RepID=UPI0021CB8CD2|nr:glycosyltransferase [Carboxylicivirga sp. A043]MCU4156464.1 glycosyltransferase [Carboxylicivirga sp. A043]